MWKQSFVATTVALGGSTDDALVALGSREAAAHGAEVDGLVARLGAPQRAARAAALATALHDVMLAIDEATLR